MLRRDFIIFHIYRKVYKLNNRNSNVWLKLLRWHDFCSTSVALFHHFANVEPMFMYKTLQRCTTVQPSSYANIGPLRTNTLVYFSLSIVTLFSSDRWCGFFGSSLKHGFFFIKRFITFRPCKQRYTSVAFISAIVQMLSIFHFQKINTNGYLLKQI